MFVDFNLSIIKIGQNQALKIIKDLIKQNFNLNFFNDNSLDKTISRENQQPFINYYCS